jgi:hypothetical protein
VTETGGPGEGGTPTSVESVNGRACLEEDSDDRRSIVHGGNVQGSRVAPTPSVECRTPVGEETTDGRRMTSTSCVVEWGEARVVGDGRVCTTTPTRWLTEEEVDHCVVTEGGCSMERSRTTATRCVRCCTLGQQVRE